MKRWFNKDDNPKDLKEHLSLLRKFIKSCPHIKSDDDVYSMFIGFDMKVQTYCQSCAGKALEKEKEKKI